ncbi:MAG: hypothetical protein HY755_12850 [Nitrospirae bacterium]|nr:hypothetical protein [Nitrospirota bacterium]
MRARDGFTGSERFILPSQRKMIIIDHHSVRHRGKEHVPDYSASLKNKDILIIEQ